MKHARIRALIVASALLAGCASVRQTTEGWWGDLTGSGGGAQPQGGSVYYAASDGLVMRSDASASASVVARLTQYQRVVRTQLKNGWAYVTTDGGQSGWVDNAQLVWRLPATAPAPAATPATKVSGDATAPAASAPAATSAPATVPEEPAPAEPAPAPTAAPEAEPAPAPSPAPAAAPPQPTTQKGQPSPDMFDPF